MRWKFVGVGFLEPCRLRAARIGDKDVHRPAHLDGVADRLGDRGLVGDVGAHIARGTSGRNRVLQRRLAAPKHRHRRAGACERRRDGAADATATTGDEGMLSVERRHAGFSDPKLL